MDNALYRVHRRQFFIARRELGRSLPSALGYFRKDLLPNGLYLYSDPELNQKKLIDGRLILGEMFAPVESDDSLLAAGRFVIIDKDSIQTDVTSSFSVFYSLDKESEIICASSESIISLLTDMPLIEYRTFKTVGGMNWTPMPLSKVNGFKRIPANSIYFFNNLSIKVDNSIPVYKGVCKSDRSKRLSERLTSIIQAISQCGRPIYLALTGGMDSRTILACLISAKVEFTAFTYKLDSVASKTDISIAKRLSKKYQFKHVVINKKTNKKSKEKLIKAYYDHNGNKCADRSLEYILGDYYREFPNDAILLHGGCFEVGRNYYHEKFFGKFSTRPEAVDDLNVFEDVFGESFHDLEKDALHEWLKLRTLFPTVEGSDLLEQLYWDQRRSCWGADNRMSEDFMAPVWIMPANDPIVLSLLSSAKFEEKSKGEIQIGAIEHMVPNLYIGFEVNPRPSFLDRLIGLATSNRSRAKLLARLKSKL